VYLRSARLLACYYCNAEEAIYRTFNAVFRKIGKLGELYPRMQLASWDFRDRVSVQLVKTECLPVLCYAVEVRPTHKCSMLLTTVFRKIFNMKSNGTMHEFEIEFGVLPVSDVINTRKKNFSLSTAFPTTFYGNCVNRLMCLIYCIRVQFS